MVRSAVVGFVSLVFAGVAEAIVHPMGPPVSCGPGCAVWTLSVTCEGLQARTAEVRIQPYPPGPRSGAVVFTTGGYGVTFYGDEGPEPAMTVSDARANGFLTFEIRWKNEVIVDGKTFNRGWIVEGAGYKRATCGYAEVIRWIQDRAPGRPGSHAMCAHGNSGGGIQIAYGLALYDLGDVLDMAVFSGGPGVARNDIGCFRQNPDPFDTVRHDAFLSPGVAGRQVTDELMGWTAPHQRYCLREGTAHDPTASLAALAEQLEQDSLASVTDPAPRADSFPHTRLNFVNSAIDHNKTIDPAIDPESPQAKIAKGHDPPAHQAAIWYSRITSTERAWYLIEGAQHSMHVTHEGGERIRQLVRDECVPRH